jgi:uncharacterized membrane protein YgdD (TMEM256/DUF423 family)
VIWVGVASRGIVSGDDDLHHEQRFFIFGTVLCGLGVAAGAFGAHGLKARLSPEMLVVFETGVRYHLIHALALLAVAWAATRWSSLAVHAAGWLFVVGVLLFSGSLYALSLTGVRGLGAITPLGGVAFILGWLLLAWGVWRGR